MSTETVTSSETPLAQRRPRPARSVRAGRAFDGLIRSVVPVALALGAGAILLLALGRHPLAFYGDIWTNGVENGAWQDSATRMAPFLLIAAGLTVIFGVTRVVNAPGESKAANIGITKDAPYKPDYYRY